VAPVVAHLDRWSRNPQQASVTADLVILCIKAPLTRRDRARSRPACWRPPAGIGRRGGPHHGIPSSLLELDFGRRQSYGPRKARATTRSAFPSRLNGPAPVPGVKDAPRRFAMACGPPLTPGIGAGGGLLRGAGR